MRIVEGIVEGCFVERQLRVVLLRDSSVLMMSNSVERKIVAGVLLRDNNNSVVVEGCRGYVFF